MSVPSRFLINSFSSFCLLFIKSIYLFSSFLLIISGTDLKCFWPFYSKKLPSAKPKLKSAFGVD